MSEDAWWRSLVRGARLGAFIGVLYSLSDLTAALLAVGWLYDPGVASVALVAVALGVATFLGAVFGALTGIVFPGILRQGRRWRLVAVVVVVPVTVLGTVARWGRNHELPPSSVVAEKTARPVLFVVVDTLRADTLYGLQANFPDAPATRRWVENALVFTDAESTAGWTIPSMAAMLTGVHNVTYDASAGRLPRYGKTLAEYFYQRGYETQALVDNVILEPRNGFAQGFERFRQRSAFRFAFTFPAFRLLPIEAHEWLRGRLYSAYDGSRDLTDRAVRIIAEERARPLLFYVHYMDPHAPYYRDPDQQPVQGDAVNYYRFRDYLRQGIDRPPNRRQLAWLRGRYVQEVNRWDTDFGRLIDAWHERYGDDGIVVLVSDHGEEFLDHGRLGHGMTVHREMVHVPLVIELPEDHACHREGVIQDPVSLLDLTPTVIELATGTPPRSEKSGPALQGQSLSPWVCGEAPAPRRPLLAVHARHGRKVYRYRDGDEIYMQTLFFDDPERREISRYNLKRDPNEHDSLWQDADLDHELQRRFARLNRALESAFDPAKTDGSEAQIETLRALGYIR